MEITKQQPEFSSESDDEIPDFSPIISSSEEEDNCSNISPKKLENHDKKNTKSKKKKLFECPRWPWLDNFEKPNSGCGFRANNFKALEKHMLRHIEDKYRPYYCKFCKENKGNSYFAQADHDLLWHWRSRRLHNDDIPEEFKFLQIKRECKNPKGTWDIFTKSKVLQDCLNPNIEMRFQIRKNLESLFGPAPNPFLGPKIIDDGNESENEMEKELSNNRKQNKFKRAIRRNKRQITNDSPEKPSENTSNHHDHDDNSEMISNYFENGNESDDEAEEENLLSNNRKKSNKSKRKKILTPIRRSKRQMTKHHASEELIGPSSSEINSNNQDNSPQTESKLLSIFHDATLENRTREEINYILNIPDDNASVISSSSTEEADDNSSNICPEKIIMRNQKQVSKQNAINAPAEMSPPWSPQPSEFSENYSDLMANNSEVTPTAHSSGIMIKQENLTSNNSESSIQNQELKSKLKESEKKIKNLEKQLANADKQEHEIKKLIQMNKDLKEENDNLKTNSPFESNDYQLEIDNLRKSQNDLIKENEELKKEISRACHSQSSSNVGDDDNFIQSNESETNQENININVLQPRIDSNCSADKFKKQPKDKNKELNDVKDPAMTKTEKVFKSLGIKAGFGQGLLQLLPEEHAESADNVAAFLAFVVERQKTWQNERNGKTVENQIISTVTNVYRELNATTLYFRKCLAQTDLKGLDIKRDVINEDLLAKVLFKSIVFRLIDRVETFMDFGGIPKLEELQKFIKFIKRRKKQGLSIFSIDHVNIGVDRTIKCYEYVKENFSKLTKDIIVAAKERSMKKCRDVIKGIFGVGNFYSCQILFDLLDCKVLGPNTDNQWVHLDLGAKAGLEKIFSSQKTSKQELKYARILRDLCNPSGLNGFGKIGLKFDLFLQKPLSLKNIEHALCGYDTYYKNVTGRSKVKKLTSQKYQNEESICGICSKKANHGKKCYWCGTIYHKFCKPNWNENPDELQLCDICHKFEFAWRQDDFDYEEDDNA